MRPHEFFDLLIELGHHLEQSKLRPRDVVLNEGDRKELEWYRSLSFNKKNADAGIPQIGGNTAQKLHELWHKKEQLEWLIERSLFLARRESDEKWRIYFTITTGPVMAPGQEPGFDTPEEAIDAAMERIV